MKKLLGLSLLLVASMSFANAVTDVAKDAINLGDRAVEVVVGDAKHANGLAKTAVRAGLLSLLTHFATQAGLEAAKALGIDLSTAKLSPAQVEAIAHLGVQALDAVRAGEVSLSGVDKYALAARAAGASLARPTVQYHHAALKAALAK